jgi:hypothetical protein
VRTQKLLNEACDAGKMKRRVRRELAALLPLPIDELMQGIGATLLGMAVIIGQLLRSGAWRRKTRDARKLWKRNGKLPIWRARLGKTRGARKLLKGLANPTIRPRATGKTRVRDRGVGSKMLGVR